jgi:hypothetical protein
MGKSPGSGKPYPCSSLVTSLDASSATFIFVFESGVTDRPCGQVVRVSGYRYGDRIRFPALPDFLRSSGPGMWSTQHRE